jgi:hypothetical protein
MNPKSVQKGLVGLLGVQVLLAAFTWWPDAGRPEARPVFPFGEDAVTEIAIASSMTADDDGLVLKRDGDGWVLASAYDYPAKTDAVDEVLEKLLDVKVREPVARNAENHAALNVSADNATRRVTVKAGEESVSVLLGTAGNARSYLREPGANDVYQVNGLGAWSIRDTPSTYLERKALDVDPTTLETFSLTNANGTVNLVRAEDQTWTSPDLEEGQSLDQAAVDKLFKQTLSVNLTSPADPANDPFTAEGAAILRWSVADEEAGQSVGRSAALWTDPEDLNVFRVEDADRPVVVGSITTRNAYRDTTLDRLLSDAPEAVPTIP